MVDDLSHPDLIWTVSGTHLAGQANPDRVGFKQILPPAHLDIADNLVRLYVHELSHRTGIGAAFALVTGGDSYSRFPLHSLEEESSLFTDDLPFPCVLHQKPFPGSCVDHPLKLAKFSVTIIPTYTLVFLWTLSRAKGEET